MRRFLAVSITLTCFSALAALASDPPVISVTPKTAQKVVSGPKEFFTGRVQIAGQFQRDEPSRVTGAFVTFEPGARTAWHSHPAGQTLIVTEGAGVIQEWGGEPQEIREGDVVWTPPGVKHWHGANTRELMSHIAIQEKYLGTNVEWMEQVTSEQYKSANETTK